MGAREEAVIQAMEHGRTERRVVYVPDHESFGKFMLSQQVRKPVAEVAAKISELAGQLAPRRKARGVVPEDAQTLASSFKVKVEAGVITVNDAFPAPRVKVEVYNEQRAAAPMEFGNQHVSGHRMLGRAGAQYGDLHSSRDLP